MKTSSGPRLVTDGVLDRFRAQAADRATWAARRALVVAREGRASEDMRALCAALYKSLTGVEVAAWDAFAYDRQTTYNWMDDRAWLASAGDGVLMSMHCFGALPGDGVDYVYHVLVRDRVRVIVDWGSDYSQDELVFEVSGASEAEVAGALAALRALCEARAMTVRGERALAADAPLRRHSG